MGNLCLAPKGVAQPGKFEDPATAQRANALLNRWRSGEVTLLQRLYRQARLAQAPGAGKTPGLDRACFMELFSGLSHAKPADVCDAAFDLFDSTGNGHVSFRDFCRTLSW